jgi:hypothetical protein
VTPKPAATKDAKDKDKDKDKEVDAAIWLTLRVLVVLRRIN